MNDGPLPEIEARAFDARVVKKSRSGRVFLLESNHEALPQVGRILLLRRAGQPAFAVRALKIYTEKSSFAAKNLKTYPGNAPLDSGEALSAVEKISDVVPPPPSAQDRKDIAELETAVPDTAPPPGPVIEPTPEAAPAVVPEAIPSPSPQVSETPAAAPAPPIPAEAEDSTLESILNDTPTAPPAQPATAPPPPAEDAEVNQLLEGMGKENPPSPSDAELGPDLQAEPTAPTRQEPPELSADPPVRQEDNSTAEPPEQGDLESEGDAPEDDEDMLGLAIEEKPVFDPHKHWLTLNFGFLPNAGLAAEDGTVETQYFAAAGLRYGVTIAKQFWAKSGKAQDSLSLEGGFYYYKALNVVTEGDAYNVLPVVATLRYTLNLSENFSTFLYGGVTKAFATASTDVPSEEDAALNAAALSTLTPAVGLGLMFRVGPNWYARFDAGVDVVGLGLVLRF